MLESTVELLCGLFLSALMLLIGSCIVGSIVAALQSQPRDRYGGYKEEVRFPGRSDCLGGPQSRYSLHEDELSEEIHYGRRRAQELERVV
jgi:hypothetical protein